MDIGEQADQMRINNQQQKKKSNHKGRPSGSSRNQHGDSAEKKQGTDQVEKKFPAGQAVGHWKKSAHKIPRNKLNDSKRDDGDGKKKSARFIELLHEAKFRFGKEYTGFYYKQNGVSEQC